MAYSAVSKVTDGVDTVLADQYNSLYAEIKAALEGLSTHDVDISFTYNGGSGGNLVDTVTITDNTGDTGFLISGTGSYTYDANDKLTQFSFTFSSLGITVTETYSYTGDYVTSISRTIT